MSIKEALKKNKLLKRNVKKVKISREYLNDVHHLNEFFAENEKTQEQLEYKILLLVHSIEKGMCHPKPRPFGYGKIESILRYLSIYEDRHFSLESSAYNMGISIIDKWIEFFKEKNWIDDKKYKLVNSNFKDKYGSFPCRNETGIKCIDYDTLKKMYQGNFEDVLKSRFSARNYTSRPISLTDLRKAVTLARYSPSACNRQMVKVHYIRSIEKRDYLNEILHGTGGLNLETVTYLVITFDSSALEFYGERNQGYLNAGLFAMNLVNALHSIGIGSCFLQVANTTSEEKKMKKELCIPSSERIAVCIGIGYYTKVNTVPASDRKNIDEILVVHS